MSVRYPKKRGDEEEVRQASRVTPEDARQAAQDGQETDIYGAAKDTSVFGEAAADMDIKAPIPGEIRQAAQDVAADTRDANKDYLSDVYGDDAGDQGDEGDDGAPAPAEEEPQGLFEDVTDIDARQERERQAFADELAARKAEQQQKAEARAGLGGMGLSGATAELTADIGRQAERAGDIAMADLGRRQQQETFDELRRQASIWTFEEEFGVDLDGDGNEGQPPTQQERGEAPGAPDPTKGGAISIYGNDGFPLNQPPENARLIDTRLVDGTEYDIYLGTDGIEYLVNKPQSGEEAQA